MLAIQKENVPSNENQNIQPKTCEYKGLTYFVLTDMNGKCFIKTLYIKIVSNMNQHIIWN